MNFHDVHKNLRNIYIFKYKVGNLSGIVGVFIEKQA